MAVSYKYLQVVPSKLEIQCQKGMCFYLILVSIPSILILLVKNEGGWWRWGRGAGGLLNGQNPLSVTKVICGWSLRPKLFLRLLWFQIFKILIIFSFYIITRWENAGRKWFQGVIHLLQRQHKDFRIMKPSRSLFEVLQKASNPLHTSIYNDINQNTNMANSK